MKKYIQTLIAVCIGYQCIGQVASTIDYSYDSTTQTLTVTQSPTPDAGGSVVNLNNPIGSFGEVANVVYKDMYMAVTETGIYMSPNGTNISTTRLENTHLVIGKNDFAEFGGEYSLRDIVYIDDKSTVESRNPSIFGISNEMYISGNILHTIDYEVTQDPYTIDQSEFFNLENAVLDGVISISAIKPKQITTNIVGEIGILCHPGDLTDLTMSGIFNASTVDGANCTVYGVNAQSNVTMNMTGTMNVSSADNVAYGIKAKEFTGTSDLTGKFNISGESAIGITADKIAGVTVKDITVTATTGDAIAIQSAGDADITLAAGTNIKAVNDTGDGLAMKVGGKLTLTGSATIQGNIEATDLVIEKPIDLKFTSQDAYIKANLSGSQAGNFARDFYEIDPTSANALVGTYTKDKTGHYIEGSIADGSFDKDSLKGTFEQGTNGVLGWTITENTYIADNVAKTEKEKQIAKVFDSAKSVDNGGAKDQAVAALKANATQNLSSYDMSAAAKMAEEQTNTAEDIYLNNFFQTKYSWAKIRASRILQKYLPEKFQGDRFEVSVRSVNRFGTAGAESDTGEYDFTTYGAMANIESSYKSLLFGAGFGGWRSTTDYEPAGEAESTTIAVTGYIDWQITKNLDWYSQIYFGHGMNTLDAKTGGSTDWDSNLFGGFTAVRYSIQVSDSVSINPFVGLMLTYNMQDDVEDTANKATGEMDSFVNLKGVVGVEAIWQITHKWYVTGRALYAREFADTEYDMGLNIDGVGSTTIKAHEATEDVFMVGVGVGYSITENWNANIHYNAEMRTSELNHNLNFNIGYKF